jgi:hypothetical protein
LKFANWVLPLVLLAPVPAWAQDEIDPRPDCGGNSEVANVLVDAFWVRPLGAVLTVAGGALFVGTSPFTALASIPYPHDAFQRVGAVLVGAPYTYTFVRRFGDFGDPCQ